MEARALRARPQGLRGEASLEERSPSVLPRHGSVTVKKFQAQSDPETRETREAPCVEVPISAASQGITG